MYLSQLLKSSEFVHVTNVIYKLTNVVNGKVYIGQTSISLRKRLLKHISDARQDTKVKKHYLQKAIYKHGCDNFKIEILETCNKERLDEREIYWIKHFNSTCPELGYNCTHGGQGNRNAREISDKTKKLISEANKQKWADPNYRQRQKRSRSNNQRRIKITQLDLSYNFIKTWNSKKEVFENFNTQIYKLTNDQKTIRIGEFIFMKHVDYVELKLPNPVIVQLDENYNIINRYYSYTDANIKLFHLTGSYGKLQHSANQKRTKIKGTKKGGYIWMIYENYLNRLSNYDQRRSIKQV